MIRSVCFDLDGVFFTPESFKRFKKAIGGNCDKELVDEVFHASDEMRRFKKGQLSEDMFWDYVRHQLNISMTKGDIFKELRDAYEINPEVAKIVKDVRGKGFKTCVCSNNFVTRIRELDSKFRFLKEFDVVVLSYEVGVMKPDKGIFEKLVESCGVEPGEIVYSDDTPEKLAGADEMGIQTFAFDDVPQFVSKLEGLGVL